MRFDLRKVCRKFVELWCVRFDNHESCRKVGKVYRVRFDHRNACREFVLSTKKLVGFLQSLVECVLTIAKHVVTANCLEGFVTFGESLDNRKACKKLVDLCRVCFYYRKTC